MAPGVTGSSKFVNSNQPFAVYGSWLQIYIAENFLPELEAAVDIFNKSNKVIKIESKRKNANYEMSVIIIIVQFFTKY